jgi:hypothetical protein
MKLRLSKWRLLVKLLRAKQRRDKLLPLTSRLPDHRRRMSLRKGTKGKGAKTLIRNSIVKGVFIPETPFFYVATKAPQATSDARDDMAESA